MKYYQYSVYSSESFNATGKAKSDVSDILNQEGIGDIYHPSHRRLIRIIQQLLAIGGLKNGSVVIIQYPAVIDTFTKLLKKKDGIRLIGIIHDLQSIRMHVSIKREIEVLNCFDFLISHNPCMTSYLKENGCRARIIDLQLFDYLHDSSREIQEPSHKNCVCFAGNLDKSEFIPELSKIEKVTFHLYGLCKNPGILKGNTVIYKGVLPSDEIPYYLEGDYGLIWDGSSIQGCDGTLGNYLRYNNPHKLSLYIASGKPVIVWKYAAVADFVRQNQIGMLVENLFEAQDQIPKISEKEYEKMRENVLTLKEKISSGYFMKTALHKVMKEMKD